MQKRRRSSEELKIKKKKSKEKKRSIYTLLYCLNECLVHVRVQLLGKTRVKLRNPEWLNVLKKERENVVVVFGVVNIYI